MVQTHFPSDKRVMTFSFLLEANMSTQPHLPTISGRESVLRALQ